MFWLIFLNHLTVLSEWFKKNACCKHNDIGVLNYLMVLSNISKKTLPL